MKLQEAGKPNETLRALIRANPTEPAGFTPGVHPTLIPAKRLIAKKCLWLVRINQADIERMSALVRDVFVIHSWFISLTLLIWGVLTWRFAPEASGHGTDQMIDAYHNRGAHIPVIGDEVYGEAIVDFFEARGISWTAWVFDPLWSPQLIENWDFEPTRQGHFFRDRMLRANPR